MEYPGKGLKIQDFITLRAEICEQACVKAHEEIICNTASCFLFSTGLTLGSITSNKIFNSCKVWFYRGVMITP